MPYCRECGERIKETVKFCPKCGSKRESSELVHAGDIKRKFEFRKNKILMTLGGIFFIIILIGITLGGSLFLSMENDSGTTTTTSTTTIFQKITTVTTISTTTTFRKYTPTTFKEGREMILTGNFTTLSPAFVDDIQISAIEVQLDTNGKDVYWEGALLNISKKNNTSEGITLFVGTDKDFVESSYGYKFKLNHLVYNGIKAAGIVLDIKKPDDIIVQVQIIRKLEFWNQQTTTTISNSQKELSKATVECYDDICVGMRCYTTYPITDSTNYCYNDTIVFRKSRKFVCVFGHWKLQVDDKIINKCTENEVCNDGKCESSSEIKLYDGPLSWTTGPATPGLCGGGKCGHDGPEGFEGGFMPYGCDGCPDFEIELGGIKSWIKEQSKTAKIRIYSSSLDYSGVNVQAYINQKFIGNIKLKKSSNEKSYNFQWAEIISPSSKFDEYSNHLTLKANEWYAIGNGDLGKPMIIIEFIEV